MIFTVDYLHCCGIGITAIIAITYIKHISFYILKNVTEYVTHIYRKSQLTSICLKSTIETLEKLWKMFKVNNKNTRPMSMT